MPVNRKLKIIFIHIPKNGGSSMAQTLQINPSDHHKINKDILYGIDTTNHSLVLQSMPLSYYDNYLSKNFIKECFIFTIVRNPYARTVSDFAWYNRGCGTFYKFLKLVEHYVTNNKNDKLLRYNHLHTNHFLSQYEYIKHDKYEINCYIKLENLKNDFKYISDKYSGLKLYHINKSKKYGNYLNFYKDKRCIKIINRLYEKDFKEFDYKIMKC